MLALATANMRDFDAAIPAFETAVKLAPGDAVLVSDYAGVLVEVGLFEAALACANHALTLKPDLARAWAHCGRAHHAMKQPREAIQALNRALALEPGLADAHFTYGQVLDALGEPTRALQAYVEALRHAPGHRAALLACGHLALKLDDFSQAADCFSQALAQSPHDAGIMNNLAMVWQNLGRFEDSLALCEQALALAPDLHEARLNRGRALQGLARLDEALADMTAAAQAMPDHTIIQFNLGVLQLLRGDFANGLERYEYRRVLDNWQAPQHEGLELPSFEAAAGKRVLVCYEQGLGDTFQFSRYAAMLAEIAAQVTLEVQPQLARIMRSLAGVQVIAQGEPVPPYDFHVPLMSLPRLFGVRLLSMPVVTPYLSAEPARVTQWASHIGAEGLKVGIHWQGRMKGGDIQRSFPVALLEPVAQLPSIRLISLQKFGGLDQLDALPAGMTVETLGEDFDSGPDAFVDTAAVMQVCDLIISCDTSLVHLAGAMDRPLWLPLTHLAEWRWQMGRTDTPWYPSVRLFRQPTRGDWASVFQEMAAALPEIMQRKANP